MKPEIELKLSIVEGFSLEAVLAELRALGEVEDAGTIRQKDAYLDTADSTLGRAGFSARLRENGGAARIEIKPVLIKPGLVFRRQEIAAEVRGGEDPASALRGLAKKELGLDLAGPLGERVVLDTERKRYLVRNDRFLAELTFDRVTAIDPADERAASFSELEIELTDGGDESALKAVSARLVELPGLHPSGTSKHVRALRLLGLPGFEYGPPQPDFTPDDRAADVARRIARGQLDTILGHEPGARVGIDPEHLHKMRVATRRLRAMTQAFSELFGGELQQVRDELKWIAGALGDARDADVQQMELSDWRRRLGPGPDAGWLALEKALAARRVRARKRMTDALDSPRYRALVEAARASFDADCPDQRTIGEIAGDILAKRAKAFGKAVKAFAADPAPEGAHQVRIEGKKIRYAAEFMRPILSLELAAELGRLEDLQEELGQFQDALVAGTLAAELRDEALAAPPPADSAYLYVIGALAGWTATARENVAEKISPAIEKMGSTKFVKQLAKDAAAG
jgi:CHAD domain-containing protein